MSKKLTSLSLVAIYFGMCLPLAAEELMDTSEVSMKSLIQFHNITGNPETDLPVEPLSSPLVQLGKKLFFSPDLSLSGAAACSSCHHPIMAGGDGLALPVGVIVKDHTLVGQQRLNSLKSLYPNQYEKLLIPRNTPTVFNASLYRKNLFWDGRLQYVLNELPSSDNAGLPCNAAHNRLLVRLGNGYSDLRPECYQENNLLQAQARLPIVSPFEMKGFSNAHYNNRSLYDIVIQRMQKNRQWCISFRQAFADSNSSTCKDIINIDRITEALSKYQSNLIFVDNAFFRYVKGKGTLTALEKEGLKLFYTPLHQNGAGCVSCHSGNNLSDEGFYNIGVPPYGRGANGRGIDYGRKNFDFQKTPYSFRTPSLLNVALTGPYFHNGSVDSLYQAIEEHAQSRHFTRQPKLNQYDPSIAKSILELARNDPDYRRLPKHLKPESIEALVAFLQTLTDPCAKSEQCLNDLIDRAPIVTKLKKTDSIIKPVILLDDSPEPPSERPSTQAPQLNCAVKQDNEQSLDPLLSPLTNITESSGLNHRRIVGLIKPGWVMDVINWSGVSAFDIDNDCWDDLIFNDNQGNIIIFYQQPSGDFRKDILQLPNIDTTGVITPLVADIDGDYKADLFLGNNGSYHPQIVFNMIEEPSSLVLKKVHGPALNASFGDLDQDGNLDMIMAFWRTYKSARQPQVWHNSGYRNLKPEGIDYPGLRASYGEIFLGDGIIHQKHELPLFGDSDFTFTPNIADFDNDGTADVQLTADFFTSQLWQSTRDGLKDITDINVITGSFGMGAALADFDNDGDLDWFESSIYSPDQDTKYTGNRLYENLGEFKVRDATQQSGLSKGGWGWGSCAADFNNDGLLDIFHATGYGSIPKTGVFSTELQKLLDLKVLDNHKEFQNARPKLFINKGDMKFSDESAAWGLTQVNDGRGIVCFDYQQDGDIDIVISNWEGLPTLYRNNNIENNNWLSVKLIGLSGNTEALGAKLYLHTNKGIQYREVRFENNYVSSNPRQPHFGLGQDIIIQKLVIEWPAPTKMITTIVSPENNQRLFLYHPMLEKEVN